MSIVIKLFSNPYTKEYFFTTSHRQHHGLGTGWVPCSYMKPYNNIEVLREHLKDSTEIVNPDPKRILGGGKR